MPGLQSMLNFHCKPFDEWRSLDHSNDNKRRGPRDIQTNRGANEHGGWSAQCRIIGEGILSEASSLNANGSSKSRLQYRRQLIPFARLTARPLNVVEHKDTLQEDFCLLDRRPSFGVNSSGEIGLQFLFESIIIFLML